MKKISLNKIASENLTDRQMKDIKGGACYCACCKSSSDYDNGTTNASSGSSSPGFSPCSGGGYWGQEVTIYG